MTARSDSHAALDSSLLRRAEEVLQRSRILGIANTDVMTRARRLRELWEMYREVSIAREGLRTISQNAPQSAGAFDDTFFNSLAEARSEIRELLSELISEMARGGNNYRSHLEDLQKTRTSPPPANDNGDQRLRRSAGRRNNKGESVGVVAWRPGGGCQRRRPLRPANPVHNVCVLRKQIRICLRSGLHWLQSRRRAARIERGPSQLNDHVLHFVERCRTPNLQVLEG